MREENEKKLPKSWKWVKLSKICHIISGSTPQTGVNEYWDGDICWITPSDLGKLNQFEICDSARKITKAGYDSCTTQLVPPGSIVLSSRAPIGHLAIAKIPLCTNQGCKSFVPGSEVNSLFLYFALKHSVKKLQALGSGATFTEISKSQLENFIIPLPPISEQKRLATILNEQMAAVEKARVATKARLKASKALFAAYLREVFVDIQNSPRIKKLKLGDISSVVRGSSPRPKGDPKYYGGNIPRLMVEDVTRDGMYVTPKVDFLTFEGSKLSRMMKKGDVVMVTSGAPGLPAILDVDACIHDGFAGFKDLDSKIILNEYLYFYCLFARSSTDKQATGAIFRNITTDQIRNLNIFLPEINKQKIIVENLKQKIADSLKLYNLLVTQIEEINIIPSSLLRRAFNGEMEI